MKRTRALIFSAFALTALTTAQAQDARTAIGGLLISPLLHRVSVKPGQQSEITFTVENPTQVSETLSGQISSFTVEDWTYRTQYDQPHPRDCREWFAQQTIEQPVTPGQRMDLRMKFEAPRNAKGPYWCMLKLTPKPTGSTTKALITYEVPVVIVVDKNPKPQLEIASPTIRESVSRDNKRSYVASLPIVNASGGFTPIGAEGVLRNANTGRIVSTMRLEDRNLLPETKRQISFMLPDLADGKYKLTFKALMGNRALPPVTSEYSVTRGVPKLLTEGSSMALTPVSIDPTGITASIAPGGNRTMMVKVRNNGDHALPLLIEPRTVEQSANGAIGIGEDAPKNINVDIEKNESPLAPGETRVLRLQLGVPQGAGGDLWFALAIREQGNGKSLAESVFGTVNVPNSEKPLVEVQKPEVMSDAGNPVAIKFRVQNTGNVALRPDPSAAVLEGGVRLVERPAVPLIGDGGLLPGGAIENTIMIPPSLKPGDYVVEISYQYGDKDYAKVRVPIKISAPVAKKAVAKKGGR